MTLLLETRGLEKRYPLRSGMMAALRGERRSLRAVDGINLTVSPGEIVALVGESGSGKTTTGKLLTLQETPTSGEILFEGRDVTALGHLERKAYLRRVQMIFQNPYEALDPRHRVIQSVMEPLDIHNIGTAAERRANA
ncbi:MAG: ATP-binding cassette domain-containing protein, partial [Betaproteobacteria bacterium]|nr:ATP-binding cassette domain-containing protein [Betaproteobacteria bacterium]